MTVQGARSIVAKAGNFASVLHASADRAPEATALRCGGSALTYAELRVAADRVAAALAATTLSPGDRVLLVGPTVPAWVSAYFGMLAAGMAVVSVNPMATQAEIEYFLTDSGAALALGLDDAAGTVRRAAAAAGCPYWSFDPDADRDELAATAPLLREREPDDLAVLIYTSGTTGRPKGAMLSHGNLTAAAETFVDELRLTDRDGMLICLPLSHIFGQGCLLNPAIKSGAGMTLQPRFDGLEAIELIERDGLTIFAGVPTMYNAILRAPSTAGRNLGDALRLAISGGAPIPLDILRRFEKQFDCPILEGWGMTESTGMGTFNRLDRLRKPGRVGVALPGLSIRIADEEGHDVEQGAVGEILLSGTTVMRGYWRRPEETADAFSGSWLRTGDLGSADEDGDIAIVDRKKDLILRGGYNVYPREVEEVLAEHPDIIEALVVGVADDHFGEEVGAAIVARPGSGLDSEGISEWTKARLSPYKRPRVIRFLSELPRTSTGKLSRRSLDLLSIDRDCTTPRSDDAPSGGLT